MKKNFLTYEQQIVKLQNEKALTISDVPSAIKTLENISYYALISGYKNMFKHKPSGKYLYGVTFEEIAAFYYFDEELRTLFLKYILHVERHLKSLISYYFCEKFGEHQSEYLNAANFNTANKNQKAVNRLVTSLARTISLPTHHQYIEHYAKEYHNVPLWVAMNAITFGQLSAFYQYMPNDIQTKISKHFPGYSEKQLHQFITIIAKCRNVCAHNERLYNFHTNDAIPNTILHNKLNIPTSKGCYMLGKHDLFAVVLSLRYLIGNEEFKIFKASLTRLVKHVLKQCPHLTEIQLLKEMGFPKNWGKICRYKTY
ncbi:Abi family protein [Blautia schinkii]|nr:Abi family protein [Blautia schinkii]